MALFFYYAFAYAKIIAIFRALVVKCIMVRRPRIREALGVGCIVVLSTQYCIATIQVVKSDCNDLEIDQRIKETSKRMTSASGGTQKSSLSTVPNDATICVRWNVKMDDWWSQHPEFDEGTHNDTHQCFDRLANDLQIAEYFKIHHIQFHSDCRHGVTVRRMWNSGWEADISNVVDGIYEAMKTNIPLQMTVLGSRRGEWWHYAAMKETGKNATCPQKDISCYFLPLSRCRANSEVTITGLINDIPKSRWVFDFVIRSQQWLRKRVYDFLKAKGPKIVGQCAVIHVRRADVILHGVTSRKYYPISDYINKLPRRRRQKGSNVVLLTDDANAVDEAFEFFPELKWHFLDRPRHRGSEGGWENQIPSNNPAFEVVVIKAIFRMVRPCNVLVHGQGGFSNAILGAMMMNQKKILRLRVEGNNTNGADIYNDTNSMSKEYLENFLNDRRKELNQEPAMVDSFVEYPVNRVMTFLGTH